MCGPWAIPLALIAAGSVSKYVGETKAKQAQTNAFHNEESRQEALTGQQQTSFQDSLDRVKALASPGGQANAAAARESNLAAAISPASSAGSYLPGSSSAAPIVAAASDKAAADTHAKSLSLAHTLAALGGSGDALQTANTAIGRNSSNIGQIASFKQGSAGVLDAEMRAAAHKGQFLRGVGSLAQQIGMAALGAQVGGGSGIFGKEAATVGGEAVGTAPVYGGTLGGIY